MRQKYGLLVVVVGLAVVSLIGCQLFERNQSSPTMPGGGRDRPERCGVWQ